ncbi:MAG: phosphotransferase family protein [Myxococcota bacterium]
MSETSKVGPVREEHRFNEAALDAWLRENVRGGRPESVAIEQFDAGQSNPTFRLTYPDERWVLRKKPPGELLPKAHQVLREARVMQALASTDVPVPEIGGFTDDASIIGTDFFVMRHVDGRILKDGRLPDQTPAERTAMGHEMASVLARIHGVNLEAAGLSDFGRQGGYIERQIATWSKQYERAATDPIPEMDQLMAWLPKNIPGGSQTTLVHGDYRVDNLMWAPEATQVVAVLDWELSTLGDPLADLAYACLPYLIPTPYHPPLSTVAGGESGLLTMSAFVESYVEASGNRADNLDYYIAFSMFRLVSILQGVYARGLQGNASSTSALQMGALARMLAEHAWKGVEKGSFSED